MSTGKYWFWRDTARTPTFLGVDARASVAFLICLLHFRPWTLKLALVTMAALGLLSHFGYTVPVFLRTLRRAAIGPLAMAFSLIGIGDSTSDGSRVEARPWWYRRRFHRSSEI